MPPAHPIDHPPRTGSGASARGERLRPGLAVVSAILGALGLAAAMAAFGTGSHALSPHPDTTRSTLVEGAVVVTLLAALFLSLLVGALRRTPLVHSMSAHRAAVWAAAAISLGVLLASAWRGAATYVCCNPDFLTVPLGGFALTVS